mgnify:CR=1 FL=1
MLYLILDPNHSSAKELAERITVITDRGQHEVNPAILHIEPTDTADSIQQKAMDYMGKHGQPGAIFLESELPGAEPSKMLTIIKTLGKDVPIVLLGNNTAHILNEARNSRDGAPACIASAIPKPMNDHSVGTALQKLLFSAPRRPHKKTGDRHPAL